MRVLRRFAVLAGLLLAAGSGPLAAEEFRLSPLGQPPDWQRLESFDDCLLASDAARLLHEVYAPHGTGGTVSVDAGGSPGSLVVQLGGTSREGEGPAEWVHSLLTDSRLLKRPPRYWRARDELPPAADEAKPLAGVKIALDPGHLGADWAKMEERWFIIGDARPVMEGEMTLQVARLLAERLRGLGAEVSLVRDSGEPATDKRPADFLDLARTQLAARGVSNPPATYRDHFDPERLNTLQWESEHLFVRADILGRARRVNGELKPDLALCLHFNAEPWGDPARPELVEKNHFHLIVNGCYGPDELAEDDTRLQMLVKLLNGSHAEELAAADRVAGAVASATGLPPYQYTKPNAVRVGPNPYVWARNLLANRLYECPVLYLEPYVMNSPDVFARVQAGDYEGEREVNGIRRRSIFREYADAVAAGVAAHYRERKWAAAGK